MKEIFSVLVKWFSTGLPSGLTSVLTTFFLEIVKETAKELFAKAKQMLAAKRHRQQKKGSTAGTAEPISPNSPTESEKSNTPD